MKILKSTSQKKVKSKYGNFDFEPDDGFEIRIYVDYESKLLVIEELPINVESGKLYLPTQYIVDAKSAELLTYNQYKKYFNYDVHEAKSKDNELLLKYQRKHDFETKRDYKTEKLISIKNGKMISKSEGVAFCSEKRSNLLEEYMNAKKSPISKKNKWPKQFCPNCEQSVSYSSRYPKYLCQDCVKLLTDKNGRKVAFSNTEFLGFGCQGYYVDIEPKEKYNLDTCFIEEIEFYAQEARFGGIVVQKKD